MTGKAGFEGIASQVTVYDDTPPEKMLERVQGHAVVVTKEIPVPGELIRQFPATVKLLCEAGTGYNNIDLAAAREKGITVCNVPAYSSERVAPDRAAADAEPGLVDDKTAADAGPGRPHQLHPLPGGGPCGAERQDAGRCGCGQYRPGGDPGRAGAGDEYPGDRPPPPPG